jgi:hypothetical protein
MSGQNYADQAPTAWPMFSSAMVEAWQARTEALMRAEMEFLGEAQRVATAWTERRREAMEEGIRTMQALCACKDGTAFAATTGEWLKGSLARLQADLHDSREETMRLVEIGRKMATAGLRLEEDTAAAASSAMPGSPAAIVEREAARSRNAAKAQSPGAAMERSAAE